MGYLEIAKRAIEEMEASNKTQNTIRNGQAQATDAPATTYTTETTKVPSMPPGITLIRWEPKPAPVILTRASVVTDVQSFVAATLQQLGRLLHSKAELCRLRDLIDALEDCGVIVEVPGIGNGR